MNTTPKVVKDVLRINTSALYPVKVVLLNMFGQVVLNQQAKAKNGVAHIRVATLSYGTYQAQIQLDNHTFTELIEKR